MRAKLLLMPGNAVGERLCAIAEDILTGVSISFGHTFLLLREKIGDSSIHAYGAPLTEETVEACRQADGVVLGDMDCAGADSLLLSLGISCRVRAFSLRGGKRFYLLQTAGLDAKTLREAMRQAFEMAREEDLPLYHVMPSGKSQAQWQEALKIQTGERSYVSVTELSPPQAVEMLVRNPDALGVLLVPPYAGSMLCAMATALHGAPMLLFDSCKGAGRLIAAPVVSSDAEADDELNPMGVILAVADILRNALKLEKEADCIEAAVKNVLEAGWRTPDMAWAGTEPISTEKMLRLVADQIDLAGELLGSQGGSK